jgi:outer membrane protein TolC
MNVNFRILLLLACLSRAGLVPGAAAPAAGTNTVSVSPALLAELFDEARTNNAGLRVAEARVIASQRAIETVRSWEDPRVNLGGLIGPARRMPSQDGDLTYGIEQMLPLWDRPRLNRAILVAGSQTEATEAALRETQVRREVTRSLLRLALIHRTTGFLTNDLAWLETLIGLQEERFRAGFGSHTDLLQLQNEKSRRADAVRTEQSRARTEQAAVNRLLGRPLEAPWPAVELPFLAPPVVHSTALADYAATNEPRLKVLRQTKAQAEAVTRLTETLRRPDVSFGIQGRQYSGDGGLREGMFSVSLNLPWWNAPKYRADLRRDEAKVRAIEAEMADYELSVREEILRLTLATDTAHREAVLYRDEILQRTQQAMASHQAMWEGNRGLLRDVLDARRAYLEGQLMRDRAIVEQHLAFADLAALCDLPDYFQLGRLLLQLRTASPHPHPPAAKSAP